MCSSDLSTNGQGLCRQGDNVLGCDGDDVDLAVRGRHAWVAVAPIITVSPGNHQTLHSGLALVDGFHVGAQVVNAVETTPTFVTQEGFLSLVTSWRKIKRKRSR